MMRFLIAVLAMTAATPALAQNAQAPAAGAHQGHEGHAAPAPAAGAQAQTPPPGSEAVGTTAAAFGQCVAAGIGTDTTTDPDALAARTVTGCRTQLTALQGAVDTMIQSQPSLTDEQKTAARAQARERFAGVQGEIAGRIRQSRAGGAAATSAPAQTPAATPTPTPQN